MSQAIAESLLARAEARASAQGEALAVSEQAEEQGEAPAVSEQADEQAAEQAVEQAAAKRVWAHQQAAEQAEADSALEAKERRLRLARPLNALSPAMLRELKELDEPPQAVRDVLDGVCAVLHGAARGWEASRKALDPTLVGKLRACPADAVPPRRLALLRALLADESRQLRPEAVEKVSWAAAALCRWLHALVDAAAASDAGRGA